MIVWLCVIFVRIGGTSSGTLPTVSIDNIASRQDCERVGRFLAAGSFNGARIDEDHGSYRCIAVRKVRP